MEWKPLIYLVEDEPDIREIESVAMKRNGFAYEVFGNGESFLGRVQERTPDLVLLDIRLPGQSGLEVLRILRDNEETRRVPVLMVTALSSDTDVMQGLDLGADDYITKPFNILVLVSRIKALLRRTLPEEEHAKIRSGAIVLDLDAMTCECAGEEVRLATKEFELLRVLVENVGKVLSRDVLMDRVWDTDYIGSTRTRDMHINHVRKKLGPEGARIQTVWGKGYKLV